MRFNLNPPNVEAPAACVKRGMAPGARARGAEDEDGGFHPPILTRYRCSGAARLKHRIGDMAVLLAIGTGAEALHSPVKAGEEAPLTLAEELYRTCGAAGASIA